MGRHQAPPPPEPLVRMDAKTIIATLVAIAVALGIWLGVRDRIYDDTIAPRAAAAATCTGDTGVRIVVDSTLNDPLTTLAQAFNNTRPVVAGHCVTLAVAAVAGYRVRDGLLDTWNTAALGPVPTAWIPMSSVTSAPVLRGKPTAVAPQPASFVHSPIVLAVPQQIAANLQEVSWSSVPTLNTAGALNAVPGLAGWGSLRLAAPTGPDSDATYLAAAAIAAVVSGTNPLTRATLGTPGVDAAWDQAFGTQRRSTTATQLRRLTAAVRRSSGQAATVRSMPVTEQQFVHAQSRLVAVRPSGPTPVADYPLLRLTRPEVTADQRTALDDFLRYVGTPENLNVLVRDGFRVNNVAAPPDADTPVGAFAFPELDTLLDTPSTAVLTALRDRIRAIRPQS